MRYTILVFSVALLAGTVQPGGALRAEDPASPRRGCAGQQSWWKPYRPPCTEREDVFEFTQKPSVKLIDRDRCEITFAVKGHCDVTVGIIDEEGRVVPLSRWWYPIPQYYTAVSPDGKWLYVTGIGGPGGGRIEGSGRAGEKGCTEFWGRPAVITGMAFINGAGIDEHGMLYFPCASPRVVNGRPFLENRGGNFGVRPDEVPRRNRSPATGVFIKGNRWV